MEIREIPPTSEVEIDIIVPNAATGIVGSPTPSKAPEEVSRFRDVYKVDVSRGLHSQSCI
jgi:hypothetical protein